MIVFDDFFLSKEVQVLAFKQIVSYLVPSLVKTQTQTTVAGLLKYEKFNSMCLVHVIKFFNNSDAILNFEHIAMHCG